MKRLIVVLVAIALSGCSFFRAAEKDPVAALTAVKADARKVKADTAKACADFELAESKGLIPAGKVKDDLDLFCALDARLQ